MLQDTSGLFRLVYRSRCGLAGSEGEVETALAAIVAASRRRNTEVGVTGGLMFTRRLFVQALEGPAAAVEATFERICCDLRHDAIEVVECGPIVERAFGTWSMSHVAPEAPVQGSNAVGPSAAGEDEAAVVDAAITAMKLMIALARASEPACPRDQARVVERRSRA